MPSLEGLETWLDYELLVIASALSFVAALLGLTWLSEYVGALPLANPVFGLLFTGTGIAVIVLLIWQAGRYSRS